MELTSTLAQNFDPLGIHTGDSIVIAPSQTLSDVSLLSSASLTGEAGRTLTRVAQ